MDLGSLLLSILALFGLGGGEPALSEPYGGTGAPLSPPPVWNEELFEDVLSPEWVSPEEWEELISPDFQPSPAPIKEKEVLAGVPVAPSVFYDGCEELSRLARGSDVQAVLDQYDALYADFLLVDTQSTRDYLAYCANVLDEELYRRQSDSEERRSELGAALCEAARDVMEGPCAKEFRQHVGPGAADYFADYASVDGLGSELLDREAELVAEYHETITLSQDWSYPYNGRDWTMDMLSGDEGDAFYEEDPDAFFEVYGELQRQVNEAVGPLFVELVQLRDEYAELQGYDSYADYAYEQLFDRDYTTDDAQAFCDAVKESVAPAYYDEVYYSGVSNPAYEQNGAWTGPRLVEILGRYAGRIHPQAGQAFDRLRDGPLYDIDSGRNRMGTAFNTNLAQDKSSFIFMTPDSSDSDLAVLCHEFGHFLDSYLNPPPNVLADSGNFDLFEIHSNGMEILYLYYYDEIYGDRAAAAEYAVLEGQLGSIVDGCLFDEFQRRIYEDPDMSLEEINRLYSQLCVEYGEYDAIDEDDFYWVYISHTFDSPLYYISYAASSLAALQLWDQSQGGYDAAVVHYMDIVRAGAYDKGYLQVMEEAGLRTFRGEGAVEAVCQPVLDYLWSLW